MKNQYFGDVNDYRKFGLLRGLERHAGLRVGVWWMLTPDDGRSDGNFTQYLAQPGRWRHFDPQLFDALAAAVPSGRSVRVFPSLELLRSARFVDEIVPDSAAAREACFSAARALLGGSDLVFVDPDNGLEIASCRVGRKGSSKYVRREELRTLFQDGPSLLVYQHFRREERSAFISRHAAELMAITGAQTALCFRTSNVAFFLLPQAAHQPSLRAAAHSVVADWAGQFGLWGASDV